jgi:hypothetical protein
LSASATSALTAYLLFCVSLKMKPPARKTYPAGRDCSRDAQPATVERGG